MVSIYIPERTHLIAPGCAPCLVPFCINFDSVLIEEITDGTVRKIQNVATAHTKQLFLFATLTASQVRHDPTQSQPGKDQGTVPR